MQHHTLPPRPQHMRLPMHQGPMHPGHPPPPHMAINMGPPPAQQQPHHMPNAPPRGPPPQQFGIPQMRDQNRLGHHQHPQQLQQQRINNQIPQNHMQQQHKGRPQHIGGGAHQGPVKHVNMQKAGPPPTIRNNVQQPQQPQKAQQAQQPQQPQQLQQPRLPPPQPLPIAGSCGGPQMQLLKGPPQPQLQQQQPQLAQQQKIVNPMQQGPPSHQNNKQTYNLSRPPPAQPQQRQPNQRQTQQHQQKQQQNAQHRTQPRQQQQPPHRQQQKFSHPRTILQNPNRANGNNPQRISVSAATPLPTVVEVESVDVSSTQTAASGPVSEQLSATAEDFTPAQKAPLEDKTENDSSGLLNDILSVVMKGDGCFSNSKEKTPMCLVNELARYNKILHQYRLTGENGPAHCKRFTVTLKLGDEEYTAEGFKIKKAQHTAAAEAIKKTKYKHPLPKAIRRPEESLRTTITPTVELNALAMKLGQQTYYVFDPRSQSEPGGTLPNGQYHQTTNHLNNPRMSRSVTFSPAVLQHPQQQQRFSAGRGFPPKFPGPGRIPAVNGINGIPPHMTNGAPPELCKITLIVGKQKFIGTGKTLQSAKHDAASRALQVLKTQAANKFKELLTRTAEEGDWKSPISLVHEIAIKRNLTVTFKVLREEGPAHMKNFITTCEVGNIVTEGDGNGKKISKKRAAEKMLEELKKLPPPSPSKSPPVKRIKVKNFKRKTSPTGKKKGSSSIREKTESECAEDANPISRLIQIQQSRNEKEPTYELISRSGESKKREFVMEVNIPGKVARGIGLSKKLAKRNAAHNLLVSMGIDVDSNGDEENNSKIANKNTDSKVARKVKFTDNNISNQTSDANGGPSGRQIVPGVLLLHQHSKDSDEAENSDGVEPLPAEETSVMSSPPAKNKCGLPSADGGSSVRPKDQLLYLAQILGFQTNFSDYPKGNHSEFLSIVTLSTAPPQICHGVGLNIEESQDQAASAALQILSKLGLDNIKPKSED